MTTSQFLVILVAIIGISFGTFYIGKKFGQQEQASEFAKISGELVDIIIRGNTNNDEEQ